MGVDQVHTQKFFRGLSESELAIDGLGEFVVVLHVEGDPRYALLTGQLEHSRDHGPEDALRAVWPGHEDGLDPPILLA